MQATTPQLFLDHPVGKLELCPGIELVDGGVGKDGNIRDVTLSIIVNRVWGGVSSTIQNAIDSGNYNKHNIMSL